MRRKVGQHTLKKINRYKLSLDICFSEKLSIYLYRNRPVGRLAWWHGHRHILPKVVIVVVYDGGLGIRQVHLFYYT